MRRAFSMGQLIVFGIIAVVFFKVIVPTISGAKDDTMTYASLSELETAMKDIKSYYSLRGEFGTITTMTFVRNFDHNEDQLEFNKPVKYGVLRDGKMTFCTEMTPIMENGRAFLVLKDTYDNSEVCRQFRADPEYIKLQKYDINA